MTKIDMMGKKFNRLTVVEATDIKKDGKLHWKCKCDCGNEIIACGKLIRSGNTKSCGCLQKEKAKVHMSNYLKNNNPGLKHGLAGSRIYMCWQNMTRRCINPKSEAYKYYGARGIKVCDKWKTFEGFYEDMKEGYKENLTIDRIDSNGNYQKSNCRWSTIAEQNDNRRSNHYIEFQGKSMTVKQWAEYLGVPRTRINSRLIRGMEIEDCLNPNLFPRNNHNNCEYKSKKLKK